MSEGIESRLRHHAEKTPDEMACVYAGDVIEVVDELRTENAALTAEVERLKEGIEATIDYVLTGVHCRMIDHKMDSCDCQKIAGEFEKLLAKPEGE